MKSVKQRTTLVNCAGKCFTLRAEPDGAEIGEAWIEEDGISLSLNEGVVISGPAVGKLHLSLPDRSVAKGFYIELGRTRLKGARSKKVLDLLPRP